MDARTDAKPFTELLRAIAERYDKTVSPANATLWFGELEPYDLATIRVAFTTYLRSSDAKYGMPKSAHIVEIIEGSDDEHVATAWTAITTACRRFGRYPSIIIEDLALAETITRMFGSWAQLATTWGDNGEIMWLAKRKEFIPLYKAARRRQPRRGAEPVLLPGVAAAESGRAHWMPSGMHFGVILLDGTVRSCYLPLDGQTGLPATPLRKALTAPTQRALSPAGRPAVESDDEIPEPNPELARQILSKAYADFIERHSIDSAPARTRTDSVFDAEQDRKQELRRQYEQSKGEAAHAGGTTGVLRTPKTAQARHADRTPDARRGTAAARKRVAVRGKHRS